MDEDELSG
jgi:hypothetical protein